MFELNEIENNPSEEAIRANELYGNHLIVDDHDYPSEEALRENELFYELLGTLYGIC